MTARRVHLVLSAGGVRALAYIGVLQELEAAGIQVATVSGCSAGAVVGALVASGHSGDELERIALDADLRQLAGGRQRWIQRLFSWRRWPFAPTRVPGFAALIGQVIGPETTFADLPKPFATLGIDIVSGDYLVYTRETHPTMPVVDAVKIATALPLMFPPHRVGNRVVVDAAIAGLSPVWLTSALESFVDEPLPIVVLRTAPSPQIRTPRRLPGFLGRVVRATIEGRDALLLKGDPRIHTIEIPTASLPEDRFDLDREERARLVRVGRVVAERVIDEVDGDFAAARLHVRSAAARLPGGEEADRARRFDETAAWAGSYYAQRFLNAPRREVFISYAHEDHVWFERVLDRLRPMVRAGGIAVWTDEDIRAGDFWREELDHAIGRANVALLLLSDAYLGSDFVTGDELPKLIQAARERRTILTWAHVSRCEGYKAVVGGMQAAHSRPELPLADLSGEELERALSEIAEAVVADL